MQVKISTLKHRQSFTAIYGQLKKNIGFAVTFYTLFWYSLFEDSTQFSLFDLSLILAVHSILSTRYWLCFSLFCQTSETRCP